MKIEKIYFDMDGVLADFTIIHKEGNSLNFMKIHAKVDFKSRL
jgi:beta-phosphoglucomutase-like phosphatase (HAD superfamily)